NAVLVVPLVVFTPACGGVWPVSLALDAAVFLAEGAALERRHCTGTGAAFRTRPVLTNALLLCAAAAAIYWFVVMAWSVNRPKWL
ncbi:MAG: hypothetical protein K2Q09_09280, partial [Phycisphaerales bacterium]|nr:hypothetical protein [Phycisphaerales bacterium]